LTSIILKLFCKLEKEETLLHSFYKASITLMCKWDKTQQVIIDHFSLWTWTQKCSIKYLQIKLSNIQKNTIQNDHVAFIPHTENF
jgi:hypothetical protein